MENKFLNIFQRTLLEKKWVLLIYCLSGILLILMYVVFFPSVQESAAEVSQLVKNLPESLVKSFGLDAQSFVTFEGFIAGKNYSLVWPILLITLLVSLGSSFFAGEIEKGTIELLLSQPISRVKIFLGKFFAGVLILIFFIIASIFAVIPIAKFYNIDYKIEPFLKLGFVGFLFGLSVFGISLLFSAIFSERSKVVFSVSGILILMYVVNIVSQLKDNLEKSKYFSFFYYFNHTEILIENKINHWALGVFLGMFFISVVFAIFWFNKKDI